MGSLANFQQNRGITNQRVTAAKKLGVVAPRTADGEKLGDKPGFERLQSDLRFKHVVDTMEQELSLEGDSTDGGLVVPDWIQDAAKSKGPGKASSGQFVELFVYAALKGNLFHIQTALRSRLRFYFIRLILMGEAFSGDMRESTLPQVLREKTPKTLEGSSLDKLVADVVAEIAQRDSGLLLELVERQSCVDDESLEADPKNKLIRDAIGSTFNIFFNWIALIIAGNKLAKANKMLRQAVLQELVIEYDEYVVDHVLPLAKSWGFGDGPNDAGPDEEVGLMAQLLKGLRDYINRAMCDIMIQLEAEGTRDDETTSVMHALWSFQRKSMLDVWGQGLWILDVGAPIATMQRKGSQLTKSGEEVKKPPTVIKLLSRQRVEFEVQIIASVAATPNFVEVTINLSNISCRVAHASWDAAFMGHFPSHLAVTVTPQSAEALFSVNRSSSNQAFKINMSENLGFQASLGVGGNNVQGGLGVNAGAGAQLATSSTPWVFEQLEEGENGGSFNWSLTSWEGKAFDRLNFAGTEKKASIFSFGRRPPSNPLLGLPFGSDGGILFSEEEYSEGLKWRFPKAMEGTVVGWVVEGSVDTTIITKKGYWETRTLIFEHDLEQALIPDPDEPDKKDKKKKKKKNK